MTSPFGPSPKLRQYCDWARIEEGCDVKEGIQSAKSVIRITAPSGRHVSQVGVPDDEPLCHQTVAYLDRRLGLNSPFPKTPSGFT